MGNTATTSNSVFADREIPNDPQSPVKKPDKAAIRGWAGVIDSELESAKARLTAVETNAGTPGLNFDTLALLTAYNPTPAVAENTIAFVNFDSTAANNGKYQYKPASTPKWQKTIDRVDAEVTARQAADTAEATARQTAIDAEATRAKAAEASKADFVTPLGGTFRSAVRGFYLRTTAVPLPHCLVPTDTHASALAARENSYTKAAYGEPNTIRVSSSAATTAGEYTATAHIVITRAMLAAKGIVPGDTTKVAIGYGITKLGNLNQDPVTASMYVGLRYADADGRTDTILAYADVFWTSTASISGASAAAGNTLWNGVVTRTESSDTNARWVLFDQVAIPETFNGRHFTAIILQPTGHAVAAGASYYDITMPVVAEAGTITMPKAYVNDEDNVIYANTKQLQNHESRLVNVEKGAVSFVPPLKADTTSLNAFEGVYSAISATIAVPHSFDPSSTTGFARAYHADAWNTYGEENVIACIGSAGAATDASVPSVGVACTAANLVARGIVPSDSTPPYVSLRGSIFLTGNTNQTIDASDAIAKGACYFVLRYAGAGASLAIPYVAATDVLFGSTANPVALGKNDAIWYGVATRSVVTDGITKQVQLKKVAVPATYNGKALTGIIVISYGQVTSGGQASKLNIGHFACVAGDTVSTSDPYLNQSDNAFLQVVGTLAGERDTTTVVNIANSDTVGLIGDSLTESDYAPRGKCWAMTFSAMTDFQVENFAVSGDTYHTRLAAIRSGATPYGQYSWKDYNATHAVMTLYYNDLKFVYDTREFADDARGAIEVIKSLGAVPIVATESNDHWGLGAATLVRGIAEQNGAYFCNVLASAKKAYDMADNFCAEYWAGVHPGVRTNFIYSDAIEPFFRRFGRPKQAYKLFRLRTSVSVSSLDDLMFDKPYDRARLFEEIWLGHGALTEATEANLDKLATGTIASEVIASERQALRAGTAVAFPDYSLHEVTINAVPQNVRSATLQLSETGATVYVRNTMAAPYEDSTSQYSRFDLASTATVVAGQTYTSNDAALAGVTFTVSGLVGTTLDPTVTGPVLICSTLWPTNQVKVKLSSGVLTKTSAGGGDATIAYNVATNGFKLDYYTYFGKPEGHWVACASDGAGNYAVPSPIGGKMNFDKFSFLVYKAGGLSLTKAQLTWTGKEGKPQLRIIDSDVPARGTELLAQTLCGSSAQLASWAASTGTPSAAMPADGSVPYKPGVVPRSKCDGATVIGTTKVLGQAVTFTATDEDRDARIVVMARRNPAQFVPSGHTYPDDAAVNRHSFDLGLLKVQIETPAGRAEVSDAIGLHWREVRLRTTLSALTTGATLRISGDHSDIEVAYASMKFVDG
jgi:hypothetical protein